METNQYPKKNITQYVHRLKLTFKYCKIERLERKDKSTEDEFAHLRLIEGKQDT